MIRSLNKLVPKSKTSSNARQIQSQAWEHDNIIKKNFELRKVLKGVISSRIQG